MTLIDKVMNALASIKLGLGETGTHYRIKHDGYVMSDIREALIPILTPTGEVGELLDQIEFAVKNPRKMNGMWIPSGADAFVRLQTHILTLQERYKWLTDPQVCIEFCLWKGPTGKWHFDYLGNSPETNPENKYDTADDAVDVARRIKHE